MDIFPELVQLEIAGHMLAGYDKPLHARALVALLNGGPLPSPAYAGFLWPARFDECLPVTPDYPVPSVMAVTTVYHHAVQAENIRLIYWLGAQKQHTLRGVRPVAVTLWANLYYTNQPSDAALDAIADIAGKPDAASFCEMALRFAKKAGLRMLIWANDRFGVRPCDPDLYNWASRNGSLAQHKWLRAHGCPLTPAVVQGVLIDAWLVPMRTQMAILEWLVVDQGCPYLHANGPPGRHLPDEVRAFVMKHMTTPWQKPQGFKVALKRAYRSGGRGR